MFFRSIAIFALAVILKACSADAAESPHRFDVAEDHTRFVFAPEPVLESGMPAHGNPFVTQGYIYPYGTLTGAGSGVMEDGSPAFPDLVLGTWTCDGWFVGEGGDATTGVWLVSRQIFDFNNGDQLISQGTEIADIDVTNTRPITGAVGAYKGMSGEMQQTLLGFTEFMGVNVSFTLPDETTSMSSAASQLAASQRLMRCQGNAT